MTSTPQVFEGFWRDWTRGAVAGATLTVSSRTGAYLVAFIALFVHYAGVSCWRLISFTVFQKRASPSLKDRLRLHEQVILRNSATPAAAFRNLLKVSLSNKGRTRGWRLLTASALNLAMIIAAGIFSSKVTSTESNVRLIPKYCGRWDTFAYGGPTLTPNASSLELEEYYGSAATQTWTLSNHYASVCSGNNDYLGICPGLAPQAPHGNSTVYAGCPFNASICLDNTTVILNSGYIDSHLDLGINSAIDDRLAVSIELQCAPLKTDGYVVTYDRNNISGSGILSVFDNGEIPDNAYPLYAFKYGSSYGIGYNTTYLVSATLVDDFQFGRYTTGINYELDVEVYEACSKNSTTCGNSFTALPELVMPYRDTFLIFLSNHVAYTGAVLDPWFKAEKPVTSIYFGLEGSVNITQYSSDHATVLRCTEAIQLCRNDYTKAENCVHMNANGVPYVIDPDDQVNLTQALNLTQKQRSIAYRLQDTVLNSAIWDLAAAAGSEFLLATQELSRGVSPQLPSNQWVLEMQNWFSVMLTQMQLYSMQYVTGFQNQAWNSYISPPSEDNAWMCNSQIVQRTDYASFSVLGLCIIFIVGGLLILANVSIVFVVNRLRSNTPSNCYRKDQWDSFELLELRNFDEDHADESDEFSHTSAAPNDDSLSAPQRDEAGVGIAKTQSVRKDSAVTISENGTNP